MDLSFSENDIAFRDEVRSYLADNLPTTMTGAANDLG